MTQQNPAGPPVGWGAQPANQPFPPQSPQFPGTMPPPGPAATLPPPGLAATMPPPGPAATMPPTGLAALAPQPYGQQAYQPPYPPQQFPGAPQPAPFDGTTPVPLQVTQPGIPQPAQPVAPQLTLQAGPQFPRQRTLFDGAQTQPAQTQPAQTQPATIPQPMTAPVQQPVPQPVQQPTPQPQAVASQPQAAAPAGQTTIQQLLRAFGKQVGCERYSGDAEKVKLLEDYLWIRQLTPNLPFELFLELYAPVADFDETNLKHPTDAIKHCLPRQAKAAAERQMHHWSSKEVVDYVALYVDIIREAEATNSPLSLSFNQFLTSPAMLEPFLRGDFKEAPQPKATGPKTGGARVKSDEPVRPSANGQRTIYTQTNGRQHRGVLTAYWVDPQSSNAFADFRADSGEEFKGVGINNLELCADPPPNPPQTAAGDQLPTLGAARLTIPKAEFPNVLQALSLPVALGTVALNEAIHRFVHQFPTGHVALLEVVNAQTGPYVDARLCLNTAENVVAEINPRKNIEGIYVFETPEGTFNLEVVGNT